MWIVSLTAFIWWPFLNLISENFGEKLDVYQVLGGAAVVTAFALLFVYLLGKVFYQAASYRIAFPVAMGTAAFFSYPEAIMATQWLGGWSEWHYLFTWSGILVCAVYLGAYFSRDETGCKALILISLVLAAFPMANTAMILVSRQAPPAVTINTSPSRDNPQMMVNFDPETLAIRPNIYFFIFDSYPRADFLKQAFGYDNTNFIKQLGAMGFTFVPKSLSNYHNTGVSIATTFHMDYIYKTARRKVQKSNMLPLFDTTEGGSSVLFERLHANGYAIFAGMIRESGINECSPYCPEEKNQLLSDEQLAMIRLTPAYAVLKRLSPTIETALFTWRIKLNVTNDDLANMRQKNPFMLYYHILPPHPPFFHKADCSLHKRSGSFSVSSDDPEYESYISNMHDELKCLNGNIVDTVTRITKDDPGAIIILQSDHGIRTFEPEGEEDKNIHFNRKFANLNAIRAPENCQKWIYPRLSSVNTFRFVLGCLRGQEPTYIEDKQFITNSYGEYVQIKKPRLLT